MLAEEFGSNQSTQLGEDELREIQIRETAKDELSTQEQMN